VESIFFCVALHENSAGDVLDSLLQITVLLVTFALDYHCTEKPLDTFQASKSTINGNYCKLHDSFEVLTGELDNWLMNG
jgi:hypothetical protein